MLCHHVVYLKLILYCKSTTLQVKEKDKGKISTTENNKKRTYITVAVPRSYKNIDGNYETDVIRCILWNAIWNRKKSQLKKSMKS